MTAHQEKPAALVVQLFAPGLGYALLGRPGRAVSTVLAGLPLAFLAVVGALEELSALLAVVVPALAVLWLVVVSDARALSKTGESGPAVAWLGRHRRHLLASGLQLVFWVGGLGYLPLRQWKRFAATFVAVGLLVAVQSVAAADQAVWVATFLGPAVFTIQAVTAMDAWRLAATPA